jgi:serine/threonine-protein kinase
MPQKNGAVDREQALDEILAGYLRAIQQGQAPSRHDLLTRYPDLAPDLAAFLADRARFDRLTAPLRQALARSARLARGTTIDHYDVLEEIGHGGMGVIYKARHRTLNRIVALKMLRAGLWATPADLQRFRTEADAVANLDHPHIVPIYEAGVFQGQPYFTMKLIEGGSLAQVEFMGHTSGVGGQDSEGRGQGAGGRGRSGRWAAEIVAIVARAVHYAHQRGILHRDIKPANILLDAEERPHITDFGLAKRMNRVAAHGEASTADVLESMEGGLTQTGSILGTPSYMAPEQACGQRGLVTTAADVYSLGAVLYHLLAGRPPFRGATPLDTLRQLMEQEAEPLRAGCPDIERDLETICLKCLEKDPRQRYASALALAEDLERFLIGKPVQARPVRVAERLWRWCRRQPALAAAGGLAALALAAMVVGSVVFAFNEARHAQELRHEKRQTQAALEEAKRQTIAAERQQALADERFHQAHQAVNDFCVRVSTKLANIPSLQPLRKELLDAALKYYQTFIEQRGQDPKLRVELADTHERVADISSAIGSKTAALQAYQESLDIYQDLIREQPSDVELLWKAARVRYNVGTHLASVEESLRVHRENQAVIEQALRDHPDHLKLQELQAVAYNSLGVVHRKVGHLDESQRCFGLACDLQEHLVAQNPNKANLERNLALFINNLGIYQNDIGHADEALQSFQRALTIRRRLAKANPSHDDYQIDVAASARDIGMIYTNKGQKKEALESFEQARAIREHLKQLHPTTTRYKAELASSYRDIGAVLHDLGRFDESLAAFEKSRVLEEQLVKGNPTVAQYQFELGQSLYRAAEVYQSKKQRDDAMRAYRKAQRILEKLVETHPDDLDYSHILGRNLDGLGVALRQTGQLEEAAALHKEALARQKAVFEKAPKIKVYRDAVDTHYVHLAEVYQAAGKAGEAVAVNLERRKLWQGTGRPLVLVARDLAHSARAVGNGKAELSAEEKAERRRYEDLVLETLQQAVANGYRAGDSLQNDTDFEPLRSRADFRDLMQRLQK